VPLLPPAGHHSKEGLVPLLPMHVQAAHAHGMVQVEAAAAVRRDAEADREAAALIRSKAGLVAAAKLHKAAAAVVSSFAQPMVSDGPAAGSAGPSAAMSASGAGSTHQLVGGGEHGATQSGHTFHGLTSGITMPASAAALAAAAAVYTAPTVLGRLFQRASMAAQPAQQTSMSNGGNVMLAGGQQQPQPPGHDMARAGSQSSRQPSTGGTGAAAPLLDGEGSQVAAAAALSPKSSGAVAGKEAVSVGGSLATAMSSATAPNPSNLTRASLGPSFSSGGSAGWAPRGAATMSGRHSIAALGPKDKVTGDSEDAALLAEAQVSTQPQETDWH
jgi:hypothetical protein